MGALLTRGTIWLALVLYALSDFLRWRTRTRPRLESWARWGWSAGLCVYLAHVAAAFHYYHDWSHAAAYADTARQTEDVFGVNWGGGIYFNYGFTAVWLEDTLWWWLAPGSFQRRPRYVDATIRAFFLFMIFNAAVVFPTGLSRWVGLGIVIGVGRHVVAGIARHRDKGVRVFFFFLRPGELNPRGHVGLSLTLAQSA